MFAYVFVMRLFFGTLSKGDVGVSKEGQDNRLFNVLRLKIISTNF